MEMDIKMQNAKFIMQNENPSRRVGVQEITSAQMIFPDRKTADEAKVQSCAETGAMQTVVKQCDIVSNGKEVRL